MIEAAGPTLTLTMPRSVPSQCAVSSERLIDVQTAHIRSVLETCGWRIRSARGAAERLGVKPTTLETRMMKLGIPRKRDFPAPAAPSSGASAS